MRLTFLSVSIVLALVPFSTTAQIIRCGLSGVVVPHDVISQEIPGPFEAAASDPGLLAGPQQFYCQPPETNGPIIEGMALAQPLNIPVVFHVITNSNNDGDLSLSAIEDQLNVVNDAFSGYFLFTVIGINRVQNDAWFQGGDAVAVETERNKVLHVDVERVLNVYSSETTALGYATYPFEHQFDNEFVNWPSDHFMQGVYIDYRTVPGGSMEEYNEHLHCPNVNEYG